MDFIDLPEQVVIIGKPGNDSEFSPGLVYGDGIVVLVVWTSEKAARRALTHHETDLVIFKVPRNDLILELVGKHLGTVYVHINPKRVEKTFLLSELHANN